MTQIENANKGNITPEMVEVASRETVTAEKLMEDISNGRTVVVKSDLHECRPVGIGRGLGIKVNANIGTSVFHCELEPELEKLAASIRYGADTVMDLSTGGDIDTVRRTIIESSSVPIGTVPIYQVITEKKEIKGVTASDFLESIRKHIASGVDFITIHAGLLKEGIPLLKDRIMGVVSRGGSFLVKWMLHHDKENPLYTEFDAILDMAREHDVVLSLGDGLRPGCLADATDSAQLHELKVLGELAQRSLAAGVQVMIEGPGHVPLDQIKENIDLQKKYCNGAPFYVLGPLVTDISPGYDHIAGAIGGAVAAAYGADFLCYLTPKEHLGLPDLEHVIDGVIASRIAAHAADIARGIKGARDRDDAMSRARSNLDWKGMKELALNPEKVETFMETDLKDSSEVCTMCGDYCSAKVNKEERAKYSG
ncbi:MAG: phosphomethylpyrimidine synthase ThiC [Spirochaetales bacterium]|nr:phosphomethylpyrimidine synthase ThiC [Spirochaetales bacterium]